MKPNQLFFHKIPIQKGRKGFTLIELVVAIFVLSMAFTGPVVLASQSIRAITPLKNRFVASNLSQEAAELVRNIRDTNFLQGLPWDNSFCPGGYPCDRIIACNFGDCTAPTLQPIGSNPPLSLSAQGFYNYGSGQASIFRRSIHFRSVSAFETEYMVTVSWPEGSSNASFVVKGNLFDWQPGAACSDGVDNDGDSFADFGGVDTNGDGTIDIPPDSGCSSTTDPSEL